MLRSIKKAFDIIKAEDAETAITVHTIRTWCKQGKIKCLTAGNKVLIDMQSLLDYNDGSDKKGFMYVNATTNRINSFQNFSSLKRFGRKAVTESSHN